VSAAKPLGRIRRWAFADVFVAVAGHELRHAGDPPRLVTAYIDG
jgi:hypothetical protein